MTTPRFTAGARGGNSHRKDLMMSNESVARDKSVSPGAVARSQRGVRSPTLLELQSDLRSARKVLEGLERQAEIAGNRMDTVTAMQLLKRARPVRAEVKLLSEAVAAIEALGYEGALFDSAVTR